MHEIEDRIFRILREMFRPDGPIERNMDLINEFGMDSIDGVEFIMELEEEFNIEIPDKDAEKLLSINDAIIYVEQQSKDRADNE